MHNCFSKISHQAYQSCIPFICNFSKCCWSTCHQYLSHSILKFLYIFLVYFQVRLGCNFFWRILKLPNTISIVQELLIKSTLWQNSYVKSSHWKEEVWIIFWVNTNKRFVPFNCCNRSRKFRFYIPKNSSSQVNIMLIKSHSLILWPIFVVIPYHIFIIWIRVFHEISLD